MQLEHIYTFGGEANYCWVRRAYMANPPEKRRTLVRKIKAWAGFTGHPCAVSEYGDTIEIRPRGVCHVIFATYSEPKDVQGECIDDDDAEGSNEGRWACPEPGDVAPALYLRRCLTP